MKDKFPISLTKDELYTIQYSTCQLRYTPEAKLSGNNEFVIKLTVDEIDVLMETLGIEADHAETPKTRKAFKSLYRKLERILEVGDDLVISSNET